MKHAAPVSFGSSVSRILESLGLTKRLRQYEVLDRWPSIVGERIAAAAEAVRIDEGKLFVHVKSAAWRNELIFLKRDLLRKINAAMGQEIVTDIIFR